MFGHCSALCMEREKYQETSYSLLFSGGIKTFISFFEALKSSKKKHAPGFSSAEVRDSGD